MINDNRDRFQFPAATWSSGTGATKGSTHERHDWNWGDFKFTERGTWTGVSGAGASAQVSGARQVINRVLGQGVACEENKRPEVFSLTIRAPRPTFGTERRSGPLREEPPEIRGATARLVGSTRAGSNRLPGSRRAAVSVMS